MQFKLSYDNGVNSFNYEFSGTNIPEENIIEAIRMSVDTLFPQALFVIPDMDDTEVDQPGVIDEAEEMRFQLYDEVDTIIEQMYGYYDE